MVVVDEAQFQSLPASIATARAYTALALGDMPATVTHGRRALELLPEDNHLSRGPAASLLALAEYASGNLEAAYQDLAEAMADFQLAGNIVFALSGTYGMADIRIAQGRLRDAIDTYERALQLATAQGEPLPTGTADLYLGLAALHHERGDRAAARQNLQESEALGEQAALPDWPHRLCRAKARMKESEGDLEAALALLDEAERLYYRTPVPDVRPIAALRPRLWLRQGRLAAARAWVRELDLAVGDELSYLRECEHITLARILIAGDTDNRADNSIPEALALLDRLLKAAEAGHRLGSVIEILLLQALAHQAQGNLPLALKPLARALALAEPEGYVRLFVDEGRPMARLLAAAAEEGLTPDYTGRLLAAFEAGAHPPETPADQAPPPAAPAQPLVEPLTPRELEVLQLIAQGLSNREIGERLFLALDTVKGHNRRIFGKLQVQRRTEAVARARELGLL
jgi:LuxR family maltose regulon positive regulatory protein